MCSSAPLPAGLVPLPPARDRPGTHDRLLAIARHLDAAAADHAGDAAVFVELDGPLVRLGLRPLLAHPTVELAGVAAAPSWWALFLVTHGRARFLDAPGADPEDIVSTFGMARGGATVSLLRRGAQVTVIPGPVRGRIPDLVRSILDAPPAAGGGRAVVG